MPDVPRLVGDPVHVQIALEHIPDRPPGRLWVLNAAVGLLHQDVERLWTSCAELPFHRYAPAPVQTSPRLLTPEVVATPDWVSWHPGESVDAAAEAACQPSVEYGIAWRREHASLAGIQALDGSEQDRIQLSP